MESSLICCVQKQHCVDDVTRRVSIAVQTAAFEVVDDIVRSSVR